MKRLILIALPLITGLFLLSCGSAPETNSYYSRLTDRPSGNWEGSSWSGFTERSRGNGNYTIGYEAYNRPGSETARYFALVRAAERAAIDGKRYFFLRPGKMRIAQNYSHFKGYTVPGYSTHRVEEHETIDDCGVVVRHIREYDDWTPEHHVPARDVTNSIAKISRSMSYSGSSKYRYDSFKILTEALNDVLGHGRPALSGPTTAQYRMWEAEEQQKAKLATKVR